MNFASTKLNFAFNSGKTDCWDLNLDPPLTSCITLGKLFNLCASVSSTVNWDNNRVIIRTI